MIDQLKSTICVHALSESMTELVNSLRISCCLTLKLVKRDKLYFTLNREGSLEAIEQTVRVKLFLHPKGPVINYREGGEYVYVKIRGGGG